MTPTNELRFIERHDEKRWHRILQQRWVLCWSEDMGGSERESEWRDVPCVKETT